jgi:hypothetical protein
MILCRSRLVVMHRAMEFRFRCTVSFSYDLSFRACSLCEPYGAGEGFNFASHFRGRRYAFCSTEFPHVCGVQGFEFLHPWLSLCLVHAQVLLSVHSCFSALAPSSGCWPPSSRSALRFRLRLHGSVVLPSVPRLRRELALTLTAFRFVSRRWLGVLESPADHSAPYATMEVGVAKRTLQPSLWLGRYGRVGFDGEMVERRITRTSVDFETRSRRVTFREWCPTPLSVVELHLCNLAFVR